MIPVLHRFWLEDGGQDIAEYAVMLATILILVIGTVRLIGQHANTTFSNVASALQWKVSVKGQKRHGSMESSSLRLKDRTILPSL